MLDLLQQNKVALVKLQDYKSGCLKVDILLFNAKSQRRKE